MILGLPLTLQQLQTPPRPRHLHHQRFRTIKFCVAISIESKDVDVLATSTNRTRPENLDRKIRLNKETGIENRPHSLFRHQSV